MYDAKDLIKLAKRENNPNRDYLLINIFQGKHYPAHPKDTFNMCSALAEKIKAEYPDEKFLIIGFAEAATAIAALVAGFLSSYYMQTTREIIDDMPALNFSEEHSHAKNQILYIRDFEKLAQNVNRIIFVEDEITTGKTLQNACNVLNAVCHAHLNFSIATLLDCTHDFQKKELEALNIDILSLMHLNKDDFDKKLEDFSANGNFYNYPINEISKISLTEKELLMQNVKQIEINNAHDPRIGSNILDVNIDLETLWEHLSLSEQELSEKKILVLGTEEFVYPAIFIGNKISKFTNNVKCHATTRSPMLPGAAQNYPLHNRVLLPSLYDDDRITYLYNLENVDMVIVITDSHRGLSPGIYALIKALKDFENENIYWVWWKK
ncbi:MAG: phosphoribosyltransferase domain-containing protein [Eubacteriales bacterium]